MPFRSDIVNADGIGIARLPEFAPRGDVWEGEA
jgi:hypothetical protein